MRIGVGPFKGHVVHLDRRGVGVERQREVDAGTRGPQFEVEHDPERVAAPDLIVLLRNHGFQASVVE